MPVDPKSTIRFPTPIAPGDPHDDGREWNQEAPEIETIHRSGYERTEDSISRSQPSIFVRFMKWTKRLGTIPRLAISVVIVIIFSAVVAIGIARLSRDDPAITVSSSERTATTMASAVTVETVTDIAEEGDSWRSIAIECDSDWQFIVEMNMSTVRENTEWCKAREGVGTNYLEKCTLEDGKTPRASRFCCLSDYKGEKLAIDTIKIGQEFKKPATCAASNKDGVATTKK